MFSIYNSSFNIISAGFDWKPVLTNWLSFLRGSGQIVIAVNKSEDDTAKVLRDFFKQWKFQNPWSQTKTEVVDIDIPYTDPEFDGRGKAAALEKCTEKFCILLDLDEVLIPRQRRFWERLAQELEHSQYEAFLIPVVDLIEREDRYAKTGLKWYLHKNLPHITRGVVKWAYREDGSIDKTKSDTCDAIHKETRELVNAAAIMNTALPSFLLVGQMEGGEIPFVYHLGYLNLEQRLKRSEFWRPVWDNRDKHSSEAAKTMEDLLAMPKYRHNLPSWRE